MAGAVAQAVVAPHFHVLGGAGSLGILFASHLHAASAHVTLLLRNAAAVDRFHAAGARITLHQDFPGRGSGQQVLTAAVQAEAADDARICSPITNLLVTTKAQDVVPAIRKVLHRVTPGLGSIILAQNGLLAVYQELWAELLSRQVGQAPSVIIGSVTHGCHVLPQPFTARHAGRGTTLLAAVDPRLDSLAHPLQQDAVTAFPPSPALEFLLSVPSLSAVRLPDHATLLRELHLKLAVNCAINPVTALLGCSNGQVAALAHARDLVRAVCDELHAVFGPSMLPPKAAQLYEAVLQVAQLTAGNKSSMLQDVISGRLTEIEFLTGYVVREGRRACVPTPANSTLYSLIKAKEQCQCTDGLATAMTSYGDAVRAVALCSHPVGVTVVGADLSHDGDLAVVTVAGDGITVYETSGQGLVASFALGGGGRCSFATPAALGPGIAATTLTEGQGAGASHRLTSWPLVVSGPRQRGAAASQASSAAKSIADAPASVALPSKPSALHILYPPSPAAQTATLAVTLEEGGLAVCRQPQGTSRPSLTHVPLPEALTPAPRLRASSHVQGRVYTLHQAAAGSPATLHELSVFPGKPRLSRTCPVPAPAPNAVAQYLHASTAFLLVSWSTGHASVVNGVGSAGALSATPLPQPPAFAAPAPEASSQQTAAGVKRKTALSAPEAAQAAAVAASGIVDSTQVILLRKTSSQEVAYALLDRQFGCVVSSGSLQLEGPPQPTTLPTELSVRSMASVPGRLLLRVGRDTLLLSVHAKPANLLTLVGRLSVSTPAPTALDVSATIATVAPVDPKQPPRLALDPIPDMAAGKMVGPAVDATVGQLVADLEAALADGTPGLPPAERLWRAAVDAVRTHASSGGGWSWVVATRLVPLTARTLAAAGQWDVLDGMLDALPPHSLPGCSRLLVDACAAHHYGLVPVLVCKLTDVAAEDVADAIRAVLDARGAKAGPDVLRRRLEHYATLRSTAEAAIAAAEEQVARAQGVEPQVATAALAAAQAAAAVVDGFTLSQALLHPLLCARCDAGALAGALRGRLANRHVDALLAYLALWVDKYATQLGVQDGGVWLQLDYRLMAPTYTQVLEWVRLLLDAHLPRLLVGHTQPRSVGHMLHATQAQAKAWQQLMPLAGALQHMQGGASLPGAHTAASSQYVVQYVDLGATGLQPVL